MRIGIVNDMPMAVEALRRALIVSGEHQVVWTAENGAVAVSRAAEDTPDLILMDLIMPVMDGVEATRKIMQSTPCNILLVTASVSGNSGKVFEAMGAGALDVVATPVTGSGKQGRAPELLKKINRIAQISRLTSRLKPDSPTKPAKVTVSAKNKQKNLIAIGSSTGGPQALLQILTLFPADFPVSIVVIQHMDKKFTEGLANWLNSQVHLNVKVLDEGERPQEGTVLIPSTDDHVIMNKDTSLTYTPESKDNYYHPSVDVFFKSLASHWNGSCLGVILTGMGRDGAEGMAALKQNGHYPIAQDRKSSVVFGMPKAAIEADAIYEVLPIDEIGTRIIELIRSGWR
ncbi:MAG: chemotaxis response regulator protein-glutamate methylesterase [Desulfobulbaceae bacterium]|nr:chemotaxis response regulator protein-glutamate methylesterase [Desulfobulbaceae bacterium]